MLEGAPFQKGDRVRLNKLEALVFNCKPVKVGKTDRKWMVEVVVYIDHTCPELIENGIAYIVYATEAEGLTLVK